MGGRERGWEGERERMGGRERGWEEGEREKWQSNQVCITYDMHMNYNNKVVPCNTDMICWYIQWYHS